MERLRYRSDDRRARKSGREVRTLRVPGPRRKRHLDAAWQHRETRAAILTAARGLADGDGLATLSLDAIAGATGFAPPTIYAYFASKADLLLCIVADDLAGFARTLRDNFPFSEPAPEEEPVPEPDAAPALSLVPAVPEPVARNSRPYDARPTCCGNNNCMPICPIAAMYNGVVHAEKAEQAGAKLIAEAVVYRVEADNKGLITAVHYKDANGNSTRVTGKLFVLSPRGRRTPADTLVRERCVPAADATAGVGDLLGAGEHEPVVLSEVPRYLE